MEHLGIQWKPEIKRALDLKIWQNNPRKISEENYDRLKKKVLEEGMHQVLTIDTDNTVISGNQRLRILWELGMAEVWCMVPERPLTEDERNKIGIQANINEGIWDVEMLANNFNIPMLLSQGLTKLDIGIKDVREDDFDAKNEIKKIVNPISQKGDVFQLGPHRIMCADSTNPEDIQTLFGDAKMKLIFTSPPYNMGGNMYGDQYSDDKERGEYVTFNLQIINEWKKYLRGFIFWNISYNKNSRDAFIEIMYRIISQTGLKFLELIVWNKKHALPITSKAMLTRQYEDVLLVGDEDSVREDIDLYFVGSNEKKAIFNKKTGKAVTNYWEIGTNNSQRDEHLACFPVKLPAEGIALMTNEGDIVGDPFLGTGTTMIAAEQTGRKCYGMEMSPVFVDLCIKRWLNSYPEVTNTRCLNRTVDMAQFI